MKISLHRTSNFRVSDRWVLCGRRKKGQKGAAAKGTVLREISSCVDEACTAKGGNAVYEGLANSVRADQHYGQHAKKEQ